MTAITTVLTDIEGTTSSIAFVHETLFPYARQRLPQWLVEHAGRPDVVEQIRAVAAEAGCAADPGEVAPVLLDWMAEDRKATPLKALQGMIWAQGYAEGELQGHVYPDTPVYLRRWVQAGRRLGVYSSGSVAAQKLIFGHSLAGDLTPLFTDYFDTRVGGKREADAYRHIVEQLAVPAASVLFLSDVGAELDAAASSGLQTCQLLRDETAVPAPAHPQAADFAAVDERFGLSVPLS